MDKVQVKFGEWLEKGFKLYKQNFSVLVLASLVGGILSIVSFFILTGPMIAGMVLICLKIFDNEAPKPELGTLFRGFDYFLQSFLFSIVWGFGLLIASSVLSLVPGLGHIVSFCLSIAVNVFIMFGMFFIVDRKLDFWTASLESINIVKGNFWPFLGLSLVASVIGSIGAILCGIGMALTIPIYFCIITVAFREGIGAQNIAFSSETYKSIDRPAD